MVGINSSSSRINRNGRELETNKVCVCLGNGEHGGEHGGKMRRLIYD